MLNMNTTTLQPSGHLRPLQEDDMENDEVVSVVIGPPAMRPQYERLNKHTPKPTNCTVANDSTPISTNLVKNLLVQLGREFLTHQVNEDFVFGQYIGNSMRNLTNEFRLKMQHEILDLVVKYQKLSRGELNMSGLIKSPPHEEISSQIITRGVKMEKRLNETDEVWPDFTNLANIVG
ncbi:jg2985 [Pararge aegeria aegeria]|uniref:Jg2985 protein n=1 Tax=Pararge aegeria aegeria TaxID=348720 RepID=A0A8S4RB68_9NEOP|nr:jg2985 [Pararge aegeria aegeria]